MSSLASATETATIEEQKYTEPDTQRRPSLSISRRGSFRYILDSIFGNKQSASDEGDFFLVFIADVWFLCRVFYSA